jgi:Fungal specific transcription factor domain
MLGTDLPKVLPQLLSLADMASLKVPSLDRPTCQTSLALIESDEQQVASTTGMSPFMTEHERADLDQVFFDRVHPVLPLFYRRRCHGWINQPLPGTARACLRSAMRTIAAAMSAPGARFCDQLYAETRRLLEDYTATSKETIELDYIQVWLLLGFYELLRVGENQAMLTAARCSRLVLMARLFEIDAPGSDEANGPQISPATPQQESHDDDSFCVVEERRRTFWLAYCLDCFLYSRNEYPPMMQEEMVSVKTELTICSWMSSR